MKRFAIYFAPSVGPLALAGATWLGRDVATGSTLPQPDPALVPLTVDPRRYGFHATLKAPFRLASGESPESLGAGMAALAARLRPVVLDGLDIALFHGFLALVPRGDTVALDALAAEVVMQLDRYRAPLTAEEIARRNPDALSRRQRHLLDTWGYPLVLDQFHFHMTLSCRLSAEQAAWMLPLAQAHFATALARPVAIDALTLLAEDAGGMFHLRQRVVLG